MATENTKPLIDAFLKLKGVRPADIATALGVTRSSISQVIAGHARSDRIEKYIARKLGVARSKLWPTASTRKGKRRAAQGEEASHVKE